LVVVVSPHPGRYKSERNPEKEYASSHRSQLSVASCQSTVSSRQLHNYGLELVIWLINITTGN
jgi:hypothetical protein